jgi:acetyl-CoA decarbonylase/synthase complex subunit epsilon
MSKVNAYETAEIRGPKVAFNLTPENSGRMIKRAKHLLIVVGGDALNMSATDGIDIPNVVIRLAKSLNGTIVASPGVFKAFQGASNVKLINMGLEDVVNRIKDGDWNGFDGTGAYDMVVFIGGLYYFQSMMLSTLKHFAPNQKTISLDRFYHPNATFSLENLTPDKWKTGIDAMLQLLEAAN